MKNTSDETRMFVCLTEDATREDFEDAIYCYGRVDREEFIRYLMRELFEVSPETLVEFYNKACEENGRGENCIYEMQEFNSMLNGYDPLEIIQNTRRISGDLEYWTHTKDGYMDFDFCED